MSLFNIFIISNAMLGNYCIYYNGETLSIIIINFVFTFVDKIRFFYFLMSDFDTNQTALNFVESLEKPSIDL